MHDDDAPTARPWTRRQTLTAAGGLGLTALLVACGAGRSSAVTTAPATSAAPTGDTGSTVPAATTATTTAASPLSCVLSPEMTEGPYYLDADLVREDITEGRPGTPLALRLTIIDATTCQPIRDAAVDVWHADAAGTYSGFAQGGGGTGTTYLRGTQRTGADGVASFSTVYPGWYQGRTTHIHVKVHVGGDEVHTGQLFFDDALNATVHATAPSKSGRELTNAQDGIYRSGGAASMAAVAGGPQAYEAIALLGVRT